jgi:hypothetical protein
MRFLRVGAGMPGGRPAASTQAFPGILPSMVNQTGRWPVSLTDGRVMARARAEAVVPHPLDATPSTAMISLRLSFASERHAAGLFAIQANTLPRYPFRL